MPTQGLSLKLYFYVKLSTGLSFSMTGQLGSSFGVLFGKHFLLVGLFHTDLQQKPNAMSQVMSMMLNDVDIELSLS